MCVLERVISARITTSHANEQLALFPLSFRCLFAPVFNRAGKRNTIICWISCKASDKYESKLSFFCAVSWKV